MYHLKHDELHYNHVPITCFNIFVGLKFLYTCFNYPMNGSFHIDEMYHLKHDELH